jgi:hypothetical protein
MQYSRLGQAGLKISELGLGSWMFGARGNPDHDECCRIIHRALDAGIKLPRPPDRSRLARRHQPDGHPPS